MVWTVIAIATLVAGIFIAIVVRMIINKKKRKNNVFLWWWLQRLPYGR